MSNIKLSRTEHILFLTDIVPSPHAGNAGAKIFAYYIQELTRRGYKASFIALGNPHELSLQHDLAHQVATYQVLPISHTVLRRLLRAARRLAQPAEYALTADSGIEQALVQVLQRHPVDIIHALHPWLIRVARRAINRLKPELRPALVGHVMDICSAQIFQRTYTNHPLKRLAETLAFARMARREFSDYSLADSLLVHNHNDLEAIRLLSNGVPQAVYSPIWFDAIDHIAASPLPRSGFRLLYVGNSADPRMHEALDWLLTRVMPLVDIDVPTVTLEIAGVQPDHKHLWHTPFKVICHPVLNTCELLSLYDSASCMVFPLQSGHYSKHVKILNAFARALPTVMTSRANFGERALSGREALLADEPDEFAQHIISLLNNPELSIQIAQGGLARIRREYTSPDLIPNSLEQCYILAKSQIAQKRYSDSSRTS